VLQSASSSNTERPAPRDNKDTIDKFIKWLEENGAEMHGCSLTHFEGYDLGVKADQDISQNSLVIAVPRKLMLSVESARKSLVQDLVDQVLPIFLLLNWDNKLEWFCPGWNTQKHA